MTRPANLNEKGESNPLDFSLGKVISKLTLGQATAALAAAAGVASSIFYLGGELSPSALELKKANSRLTDTLAKVAISDGKTRPFVIEDFIVSQKVADNGYVTSHDGKLFTGKMPGRWMPLTISDTGGKKAGNDLVLLSEITKTDLASAAKTLPSTLEFNSAHPPLIWTIEKDQELKHHPEWLPYIQMSVISREDAQKLMKAINKDASSMLERYQTDAYDLLHKRFSKEEVKLITDKVKRMGLNEFVGSWMEWLFTPRERAQLFKSLGKNNEEIGASLDSIQKDFEQLFDSYQNLPAHLIGNGMGSLTNVTPETGLLIGRLLFYVFGASKEGRIDIEQLTLGYTGSFARVRRAVSLAMDDPSKSSTYYIYDNILIIATKSDFCLVHIRVPHFNDDLRQLDNEAQAWLKQVRLLELR